MRGQGSQGEGLLWDLHSGWRGDGPGSFRKRGGSCLACPTSVSCFQGTQQVAAVSSVSPATPFQNVPPAVAQTPVIAATPVPTITANVTSVPVPPAAAPPPPATPIIPVVPPTPPVVKVSAPGPRPARGPRAVWFLGAGGAGGAAAFLGTGCLSDARCV